MTPLSNGEISNKFNFSHDLMSLLYEVYGKDFKKVIQAMKKPYDRHYFRVNTLKSDADKIYTQLSLKDFKVFKDKDIEEALYLKVSGPYTLSHYQKKTIVDKFTAESVLQGAHIYAPGIISCKGIRYGEKVMILDEKDQHIANGMAEMGETNILNLRKGLAIKIIESSYMAPSLRETEEYKQGNIYLQSLPAMITSKVLDPKPREVIVDFNCSPGGKLSHICQLTQNAGEIYGMDRSKKKIDRTRDTLSRLGCKNVVLTIQDTRYLDKDHPNLKADKCIIDPPCSALGVIPKVFDETTFENIKILSEYQMQFLPVASRILKPGGKVVYSVCTITREECEAIVNFAESQCKLELVDQYPYLGSPALNIIENPSRVQRFHPHIHGIGYFIALFEKIL